MSDNGLDRREFHKLSAAALGGMIAGATIGCGGASPSKDAAKSTTSTQSSSDPAPVALTENEKILIGGPEHTCRGLNSCKGKGRSKDNSCAGQGTCASIADSKCSGQNDCKGLGGCGELPGMNSCKAMGGCHVPLMDDAWTKARKTFETAMKKSGKTVGDAPPKAKS
jgi:hypothetical protein